LKIGVFPLALKKLEEDWMIHNLSTTAIWAFLAFCLALLVSAAGGILGADHAMRRVKVENVRLNQLSAK
jgi:hypothetical protein